MRRYLTTILVHIVAIVPVFAQNYNIRNYTTSDGLPHNNIRHIASDSSGFLWIATWDGLSRFDGYKFSNFHHIPGDSASIPFFIIRTIVVDGSNRLWILTDDGSVSMFISETSNFRILFKPPNRGSEVQSISADKNGDIWWIKKDSVYIINHNNGFRTRLSVDFPNKNEAFTAYLRAKVYTESDSIIWLAGDKVYKTHLNRKENSLKIISRYDLDLPGRKKDPVSINIDHLKTYEIEKTSSGKLYVFSSAGLFVIDEKEGRIKEVTDNPPLNDFTGNRDIYCWGTQNGEIYTYDPEQKKLIVLPPSEANIPKQIFPAGKSIIWFSSTLSTGTAAGLTRMIITPDYFTKFAVDAGKDKLPAVYSVAEDKNGNLWVGIRGLDHIVQITPEGNKKEIRNKWATGYESYGPLRAIQPVDTGIWLGYYSKLLLYYDYKTSKFKEFKTGEQSYRSLHAGKNGLLYSGDAHLSVFDPKTGIVTFHGDTSVYIGIFVIKTAPDGKIWGGMTYCHLFSYDPVKGKYRVMRQSNNIYNIEDVLPLEDGTVWTAMLGGGVAKYNPDNGTSEVYTTANGLSNNTVYSLLRDNSGNIWASTDNGISRINPSTGLIKSFGKNEGLDIIEFNSGASFRSSDSSFYFGGMGGIVRFNPVKINNSINESANQRIILTELFISGKQRVTEKPLNELDTLFLEKGEDDIHIEFSSTDFTNSDETKYRFRLYNENADWVTREKNNRNINYANLKPGYYTLEISATNSNGEWTAPRKLVIRIKPYFWQTAFFKVFAVLFMFGIFHLIISLYLRNFRQKERLKQDELRLQALRGQMNPHFIFNSLNSINYFISRNDKISANRYISDFSRLIRSILSNMGSSYVKFGIELSSIRDYLEIEHLRFGDKFDFELNTGGLEEIQGLEVFPGLVQPFIENAIWHGVRPLENRKAVIKVIFSNDKKGIIQCVIEDNGIGRKASSEINKGNSMHNSMGISIVSERLNIISKLRGIQYRLTISDIFPGTAETGTRVALQVPSKLA